MTTDYSDLRPRRMTTKSDLRNWVEDALGAHGDLDDSPKIVDAILAMDDCPRWGTDWAEFLERLMEKTSIFELAE